MAAYYDLGGLGSKQGEQVAYNWTAPSLVPQLLPWLAILALLALKPNRCASAWWVWIPLAFVGSVACLPDSVKDLLPSPQLEMFLDWVGSLGFGLAALWLLSSYLAWKHRMLAFLGMLLAQAVFSGWAYVSRQGGESFGPEQVAMGITVLVTVLIFSIALSLAGLLCRRRYGWLRLSLWLVAMLVAAWLLAVAICGVIATLASGGRVPVVAFLVAVPIAAGITFGALLPFLVLAFVNGFYRERLKGLLHLGEAPAPPVISPPLPAMAASAGS